MRFPLALVIGAAPILLGLVACSTPTDEGADLPRISLSIVGGNSQSGPAGSELAQPLVVKVTDKGKALKKYLITFRVTSGGGRMYAGSAVTDDNGIAQDYWTLGPVAGEQQVDVVAVDPLTGAKQNFGTFTATALVAAALSVTPVSQSFGSVGVGSPGAGQIFTVTNTGGAVSGAPLIEIEGPELGDFGTSNNTCTGTLNPGASCSVTVTFKPTATGARSASLKASATPGGNASAALSGTGLATGALQLSRTLVDFGSVQTGATSGTEAFTVTNVGGAKSGEVVAFLSGANPGDFQIESDNCTGQSLEVSATCEITVKFGPVAAGARTAGLKAAASPGGMAEATLTGAGQAPPAPAHLTLSSASLNFGLVALGATSPTQSITVTNDGGSVSQPLNLAISGDVAQFAIVVGGADGCIDGLTILAMQATCTVTLEFSPASAGPKTALLTVSATDAGSASAALNGVGDQMAEMSVAPSSFNFADVTIGETVDKTFVVTNAGPNASGTILVSLSGPNTSAYKIQSDACSGNSLPVAGNCQVTVRFSPRVAGERSATLNLTATPGGSLQASLTGNALAPPLLSLSASIILFGQAGSNGGSVQQSITLTNIGGAPAQGVAASQSDPMFNSGGDCPNDLPAGESCTITVSFTPPSNGVKTGTLSIDAANTSPVTATLVGEGVTGTEFSVSPEFGLFDVQPDESLDIDFTVTNVGPVPGLVAFKLASEEWDLGGIAITGFTIISGGTCLSNTTLLAPTESCTIRVRFTADLTPEPPILVIEGEDELRISASPGKTTTVPLVWLQGQN